MTTNTFFLLDTDICSYAVKPGHFGLQHHLTHPPGDFAVSAITRAELFFGLKYLGPANRLHVDVRDLLSHIPTLPWDAAAAELYAEVRFNLKSSGQTIGDLDMMIAAHALALNATLVTNNLRHYRRIHLPLK